MVKENNVIWHFALLRKCMCWGGGVRGGGVGVCEGDRFGGGWVERTVGAL